MIVKSIGMIIHIATIEEESAILRFGYELIPFISLIGGVADNLEHVLCQLQDYIPII